MSKQFEVHVSLRGKPDWVAALARSTGWEPSILNKDDQFLTNHYATYDEAKAALTDMRTTLRTGYEGNYLSAKIEQLLFYDDGRRA